MKLRISKRPLNATTQRAPVLCVANYVVDTLRQDAFLLADDRTWKAAHVAVQVSDALPAPVSSHTDESVGNSVHSGDAAPRVAGLPESKAQSSPTPRAIEAATSDISTIARAELEWSWHDADLASIFAEDIAWQRVLAWYAENLTPGCMITLPIGAAAMLCNLCNLSHGHMVALLGDKGIVTVDELSACNAGPPAIAKHGSFSFTPNLHALQLYTAAREGFTVTTPYEVGFKVLGCGFGWQPTTVPRMQAAWAAHMELFGPEQLATLQRHVRVEAATASTPLILAVLRACAWDSHVFFKFRHELVAQVTALAPDVQIDMMADLQRVAAAWFPISKTQDVAFDLGRIFMGLKQYPAAINAFSTSVSVCGEHHVSHFNIGLCYYYQAQWKAAVAAFDACLALNPSYKDAAVWRKQAVANSESGPHAANAPAATSPEPETTEAAQAASADDHHEHNSSSTD